MKHHLENKIISLKTVFLFSIPSILSSLLEPLTGIVDTALVGQVDTGMLAALGLASVLLSSFTWIFNFLIHATTQSISSSVHLKGQQESIVIEKIKISLITTLLVGISSTLLLFIFRDFFYQLIGARDLISMVNSYFVIRLIGHPATLLYTTIISILRGLGFLSASFYIIMGSTLLNIALSSLFLFVLNFGLEGVAWGSVLSNLIGLVTSYFVLAKNENLKGIFTIKTKLDYWFSFGKNSSSLFVRSLFLTGSIFLSSRLISENGGEYLAAHQVILSLWLFCSFFTDGIAITGNVWGGYLYSLKERGPLKCLSRQILTLGLLVGLFFFFLYFFLSGPILRLFTADPKVISLIMRVWPWIAVAQIISSLAYVYDGVIFGLAGFKYLAINMGIGVFFVFLPLAFGLSGVSDLVSVWAGLVFLNCYRMISSYFVERRIMSRM